MIQIIGVRTILEGVSARLASTGRQAIWLAPLLLSACGFLTTDAQRIARAKAALASGDARAAIIDFGAVHDKDPANPDAAAGLIEAQVALGDRPGARRELDKLPEAVRNSPALLSAKLGLLLLEGKNQDVVDAVAAVPGERTLAIDKLAARALLGLGKPSEAEAVVARALSKSAADADLIRLQALASFETGDPDRAISTLRSARRQISDPSLGLLEAQLLLQYARPAQSEQLLLSLIEDAPAGQPKATTATLKLALAESQIATGKFQAAEAALAQAEAVLGKSPAILLARARARAGSGDSAGGLTLLADARKAGISEAATLCFEAQLTLNGKPAGEAVELLQRCLATQPQNFAVRKLLARALLDTNRTKEAAEILEPLRAATPFDLDLLRLDLGPTGATNKEQLARALQSRLQAKGKSAGNVVAVAELMLAIGEPKKALELTDLSIDWGQAARARARIRAVATGATAPSSNTARVALTEFMQQAPDDPPTYLLASRIARQQGDLQESTRHLEDGLKRFPRSSELLMELAELRLGTGDIPGAQALTTRAGAVNPGAPALALLQARIDTAKGKPQAANDTLEAAFKASPSPALRAEVIRSRIGAGAIDSAAKELEVLEREGAPKPVVDELRATLLLRQGRAQEASALLAPLAAAAPNDPRAQLRLGVAQLASGNAAAAIPALRKSWEKDPAALPVAALLVQALIGRNQLDEALNVARKTQQSAPKKGQPFALEAAVHLKRQDLESARSALLRGNEIEPSGDLALQLYAVDSALKRSSPEAVLETAWQRTPQDLRLPLALSEAQLRAGNRGAAIATLEKASSAGGPLKAAVLNNLAWWYFEAGDKRARTTAESAFRLAPKNASIADTLGWIQVQNGQLPDGLKTLREAVELDSTSADVVEHLAEAELRSGNEAQARQRVQAFVAKHPTAANRPGMAKFLQRDAS